ncbi:MAG: glycosyltransferase, partial [Okeania sp. SIO2H7]|nr:glycosyltransferase [Okeania sp. SIO2H7]
MKIPKLVLNSQDKICFKNRLSLVIPTYNESENINGIIETLSELLDRSIPNRYELIVVDDN